MTKIFIDTDVILDLLTARHPFHADAYELFTHLEAGLLKGFVSPLVFANLFYILHKNSNSKIALDSLRRLKTLLKIVNVGEKTIELALSSNFTDFEDAIQYFSAIDAHVDCLVTRNKKDYKDPVIPILFPGEFLSRLNN